MKNKIIAALLALSLFALPALAANIKYSALTSGGTIATTDVFPVLRTLAVTGAADNGSGLIRLTTASNTGVGIATNDLLSVSSVGGTTEANGQWAVTVVNSTHVDLQGSTFAHAYISGGQLNFNPSVAVNTLATTTPGTGVATALAVNVGSAGAPVLFNGALGTPSSGVVTNLTGVAAGVTAGLVTNGIYTTDTATVTNNMLAGSIAASKLVGTDIATVGTITAGTWHGTTVDNTYLTNSATTVNGQTCTLGSTCTVAAAAGTLTGTTLVSSITASSLTSIGNGAALQTPASIVLTNGSGTAAALNIGGNAATATTATSATTAGTLTTALSANQLLGSLTAVAPTGQTVPSCSTTASALLWTSGSGFSCNTAIVASSATSATSATTATNATNTAITDDTTTNATMYPTWVTANTGNLPQKTTSTKLSYNPSTGMLTSTGFTGALTGNASTVTSGVYTTDTGTVTNTMLAGSVALTKLATQATNTVVGNATSGSAAPTALAVGTCSAAGSALNWTTNTGFGCNTSITAAAVPASGITGTTLASSVTASSLVSTSTLTGGATGTGFTIALGSSTITGTLPAANNEANLRHTPIGATFNGGGSAITAGSKSWVYIPYGSTIQSVTIACDVSGSIVFGIGMDTYANFSTSMTSIVASAPPTVTSAQKSQDLTLTGWTTAIPAGDYILFSVTSATTVTNCNIVLDTLRT